jgi:hypothetical protein
MEWKAQYIAYFSYLKYVIFLQYLSLQPILIARHHSVVNNFSSGRDSEQMRALNDDNYFNRLRYFRRMPP